MAASLIQKLVERFMKFPGIGPRQARRFVNYLLGASQHAVDGLVAEIKELREEVKQCQNCFRLFLCVNHQPAARCEICRDENRNRTLLLIVEKDVDLETVERAGVYPGTYFVLGGLVPAVEKNAAAQLRLKELKERIERQAAEGGLEEIIFALSANPEGDHTTHFLRQELALLIDTRRLRLSALGRGLSTGTELEYSDSETLKNALKNRG